MSIQCQRHVTHPACICAFAPQSFSAFIKVKKTPSAVTHVNCAWTWHKDCISGSTHLDTQFDAVSGILSAEEEQETQCCRKTGDILRDSFSALWGLYNLWREAPVIVTKDLTLCAIMEMQTDCCVIVFSRKDININSWICVENIFISWKYRGFGMPYLCIPRPLVMMENMLVSLHFTWEYRCTLK